MSLLSEIQIYLDPTTGCVMASDGGKDNEQLFTAILLSLTGDELTRNKLYTLLCKSEVGGVPGLLSRYLGATDNSVDNYIGSLAIQSYRQNILSYACHNYWSFNVTNPNHFSLHDCYLRFIGFRPYVLMMNEVTIYPLSQLLYVVAMFFSLVTNKTDVGNIQLQWLMNRSISDKHRFIDISIRLWRWIALKRWPGGMKQVFGIYHGVEHPFAEYGPSDFS